MTDRDLRGRRFDAGELGDGDWRELHDALEAGRALDASIDEVPIRVSDDFTNRVMTAVAAEPAPGSVGFLVPLRRRGLLAGFGDSVRQAWAAIGARGLPSFARATALAYVLVVTLAGVSVAGAATVGVGSALGVFGPTTASPTPFTTPGPTQPPATPGPQTAPAETEEPGESDDPSDGPEASDDHGGASGEPDDDHGGSSGHGGEGTDDHSGPSETESDGHGSDDGSHDSETQRPSDTPHPTGTPKPSETPH